MSTQTIKTLFEICETDVFDPELCFHIKETLIYFNGVNEFDEDVIPYLCGIWKINMIAVIDNNVNNNLFINTLIKVLKYCNNITDEDYNCIYSTVSFYRVNMTYVSDNIFIMLGLMCDNEFMREYFSKDGTVLKAMDELMIISTFNEDEIDTELVNALLWIIALDEDCLGKCGDEIFRFLLIEDTIKSVFDILFKKKT